MKIIVWTLVIAQLVLLLFSPVLKTWPVFRWYYKKVFYPIFEDVNTLRWKFWVVPALYLGVYTYCTILFYQDVEPLVRARLALVERWIVIPALLVALLVTGTLTMVVKPRTSRDNATYGSPWCLPCDNLIFHQNQVCRTCKLPKYARSRHCAICNQCTLVADHHCVWANNCIGAGNYQYFYGFLVVNVLLTSYGSVRLAWLWQSGDDRSLLVLGALLGSFALILIVFTYFQLALVQAGMTTGEENKWLVVHDMLREGKLVIDDTDQYFYRVGGENGDQYEFYSTNFYDGDTYEVRDYRVVRDPAEITNIYDRGGFWANLKALVMP
ncbi:LAFA_0E05116g1_1 [Lachancea sp. 'fantastica']|nr:LAFA_0E05116g1_1 [Lachancea sp. 'fantastica']